MTDTDVSFSAYLDELVAPLPDDRISANFDSQPVLFRRAIAPGVTVHVTHYVNSQRFPNSFPLAAHYGYIAGTKGQALDGKALDIYLGNYPDSEDVWRVEQLGRDGELDEHKYFAHFPNRAAVRNCFERTSGRSSLGEIEKIQWYDLLPSQRSDAEGDRYEVPEDADEIEIPEDWEAELTEDQLAIASAIPEDEPIEEVAKVNGWAVGAAIALLAASYLFSKKKGQYLSPQSESGDRAVVEPKKLAETLGDRQSTVGGALDKIGKGYASGDVAIDDWFTQASEKVVNLHTFAFILGRGGKWVMSQGDRDLLKRVLRYQRFRLSEFHSDLMQGLISDARAIARLKLYAAAALATYNAGVEQARKAAGMKYAQRFLQPAEHCADCVAYAGMGKQRIGVLPPPGVACQCGANCKCRIEYFKE